jgi:hypothetical protein
MKQLRVSIVACVLYYSVKRMNPSSRAFCQNKNTAGVDFWAADFFKGHAVT